MLTKPEIEFLVDTGILFAVTSGSSILTLLITKDNTFGFMTFIIMSVICIALYYSIDGSEG